MSKLNKINILDNFTQGRYGVVCEIGESRGDFTIDESIAYIGSLVFTGQIVKALVIYENCLDLMDETQKCEALFYLVVGQTRISQYQQSKVSLISLILLRDRLHEKKKFFIYQALAFYWYYRGRFDKTVKYANISLKASIKMKEKQFEVLALDILAHVLFEIGEVSASRKTFKDAGRIAKQLQHVGHEVAVKFSILKLRAFCQDNFLISYKDLDQGYAKLKSNDHYSRNELILEMIRLTIMAADFKKARSLLASSFDEIYSKNNRRQVARLNHLFAHLLHLEGDSLSALNLLSSAQRNLDDAVDRILIHKFNGLRCKIFSYLGDKEKLNSYLFNRDFCFGNIYNHRILARNFDLHYGSLHITIGEDPLGDLLDLVQLKNKDSYGKIIESGFLLLLKQALNLPLGEEVICLDFYKKSIGFSSKEGFSLKNEGIPANLRKILFTIKERPQNKQQLLLNVWGYNYNPLVHDNLIHSSMTRLRKVLGSYSRWLILEDGHYLLDPKVSIKSFKKEKIVHSEMIIPEELVEGFDDLNLNIRQLNLLSTSQKGSAFNIRKYMVAHSISHMTAYRDLQDLTRKGLLDTIGKGRALHYVRKNGS